MNFKCVDKLFSLLSYSVKMWKIETRLKQMSCINSNLTAFQEVTLHYSFCVCQSDTSDHQFQVSGWTFNQFPLASAREWSNTAHIMVQCSYWHGTWWRNALFLTFMQRCQSGECLFSVLIRISYPNHVGIKHTYFCLRNWWSERRKQVQIQE
jgi:hypothetical protein